MGTIYRNGTAFIGSGGAGGVELTQAEYDALPTTEKMNGSIYFISDGEASYPSASTMRYDNSTSGLTATSVQAAVDEVNEKVNDNAWDIAKLNSGYIGQSFNVAVPASTDTTIGSITLPSAGIWLIIAVATLNVSANVTYLLTVGARTVRGNGLNGGGIINSYLHQASGRETINILGYIPQACTYRVTIQAIKLR